MNGLPHRREGAAESAPSALQLHELARILRHHPRVLIGATVLSVACAVVLLSLRAPSYRASASLLLDDARPGAGILSDLALLTRPPMATSEIEVLISRSVAERAVARPENIALTERGDPRAQRSLGLTTLVDDRGRRALAGVIPGTHGMPPASKDDARLFANVESAASTSPRELHVEFVSADRVRLSSGGWLANLFTSDAAADEFTLVPGAPLEWSGLRIQLAASGDLSGRRFTLERLDESAALERVLQNTRAAETARNSGVIEVSYDDSDPHRAAEVVNALCLNYLDRSMKRGEKRASQTLEFIDGQLSSQSLALSQAEKELVALQGRSPEAIDVGKSAGEMISQLSSLQVELVQLELVRTALSEALVLLDAGSLDALSRLGPELADPVSAAYLTQITTLRAEAALQVRSDTGAFKTLVQSKQAELRLEAEALGIEIASVRQALEKIAAGDVSACGQLAGAGVHQRGADALTTAYAAQLAAERGQLATLEEQFTPEHPDVIATRRNVESTTTRLQEIGKSRLLGLETQAAQFEALLAGYDRRLADTPASERAHIETALGELRTRTRAHLMSRLDGIRGREADLGRHQRTIEARLGTLPESERTLADAKRRLSAHGEIVKFLMTRQQEAEVTRAATVPSAEFIDMASPPRRRHGPSVPFHLFGGLLIGLVTGLGLALARESFDAGILSSAELETASGLPLLGAIPDFRKGRCKAQHAGELFLALRDDPEGPIAEAYRALRANLKFVLAADPDLKLIACTSSTQGEGKSVTNIDLAMAFALGEKRVLLVDADMRRPVVHRYLDLPLAPGLAEILGNKARWSECVHQTELANLHVITAGRQPASPGDLLASSACDEFVAELRGSYDLVVFDLPPALAVADTQGFASKLDGVVLLCRSRKLTRAVVARTAEKLRGAGATLIGAVLNADRPNRSESKYGYGYGYGYGDAAPARTSPRQHARAHERD